MKKLEILEDDAKEEGGRINNVDNFVSKYRMADVYILTDEDMKELIRVLDKREIVATDEEKLFYLKISESLDKILKEHEVSNIKLGIN